MNTHLLIPFALAAMSISTVIADDKPHFVRQRFVPSESEHGSSFSSFRPEPDHKGGLFLQAWAGIGENFPVKDQAGTTLFNIVVMDGDDDQIDVKRDKSEPVIVAAIRYVVSYPSVSVSSADKATSNQAMILISIPR